MGWGELGEIEQVFGADNSGKGMGKGTRNMGLLGHIGITGIRGLAGWLWKMTHVQASGD